MLLSWLILKGHKRLAEKHFQKKIKKIQISSASNGTYKKLKSLLSSRGLKHHERAIVSGFKMVSELIKMHPEIIEGWIMSSGEYP